MIRFPPFNLIAELAERIFRKTEKKLPKYFWEDRRASQEIITEDADFEIVQPNQLQ